MPTGTLLIGVEEGHNLEDRGFVTKQNPLCQINIGSITHKTDAARHGGANPIWEERCGPVHMVEIGFDGVNLPIRHTVHVECFDPKFLSSFLHYVTCLHYSRLGATSCRFVAYLDDAAPTEAEIIVWSEHHIAEGDEVRMQCSIISQSYNEGAQPLHCLKCFCMRGMQHILSCTDIAHTLRRLAEARSH